MRRARRARARRRRLRLRRRDAGRPEARWPSHAGTRRRSRGACAGPPSRADALLSRMRRTRPARDGERSVSGRGAARGRPHGDGGFTARLARESCCPVRPLNPGRRAVDDGAANPMHSPSFAACHALPCLTVNTLAIDVGGSGLKAAVVDALGEMTCDPVRIDTPVGAHPDAIVLLLSDLVRDLPPYERIAVGFPRMVRDGVVLTAPNLGHEAWHGYALAQSHQLSLGMPVRIANDPDGQGRAVIQGRGIELVVTLGTGFGTGLYENGRLSPHLEISHQPFRKGETYDEQLGNAARKRVGHEKWQNRVLKAIDNLRRMTMFDHL